MIFAFVSCLLLYSGCNFCGGAITNGSGSSSGSSSISNLFLFLILVVWVNFLDFCDNPGSFFSEVLVLDLVHVLVLSDGLIVLGSFELVFFSFLFLPFQAF